MKFDIVCIDIDGTLLGEKHRYSERTKKAVNDCAKKGVHVVLTTGRLYNNAAYYSKKLGLKAPIIATNGAVVANEAGEIVYKKTIPHEKCMEIANVLIREKVIFQYYSLKDIYCSSYPCYLGSKYIMTRQISSGQYDINYKVTPSIKKIENTIKEESEGITKFIALSINPQKISSLKEALKKIDDIEVYGSGERSVEINYKGVSKGNAIEFLSNINNVHRDRVMCIGDNENDISMIKYAGLGVAMGNGIPYLKSIADEITDNNVEDGVAKALEKYILDFSEEGK
ncbi:MAG: Cof-type HAD-IIB family hydrolase [Clostridium sp.]|uniref:Cof-type HAD-IIB family hydrolase n=1 Tax=Clostridium sp. TaxID=1506 RepID=UPI00302D4A4F